MRSHKMSDGRRYLCCTNRHVSKEACEGAFISVTKLEQAVIVELNRLSAEYLDFSKEFTLEKERFETLACKA